MAARTKVCGVGINDADYVTSPKIGGRQVVCPYYSTWKSMLVRCYSEKYQRQQPKYKYCSVEQSWHLFSIFKSWMESKIWKGLALDKDILVFENKIYCSSSCEFVPQFLNNCFANSRNRNSHLPTGVFSPKKMEASRNRFAACINDHEGKTIHLGHYSSEFLAHRAWQKAKVELIISAAEKYKNMDCSLPKIIKAVYLRADKISDAISRGEITVSV